MWREEGLATKKNCILDKFSLKLDSKYGYYVRDCKDMRERRVLAFLVPILSPKKPYNVTLSLATTLLLAYSNYIPIDFDDVWIPIMVECMCACNYSIP